MPWTLRMMRFYLRMRLLQKKMRRSATFILPSYFIVLSGFYPA